ncbi:MAG: hypothetical protein H0X03_06240 [Nitrosopumilus sp.]|nr:hypothetical protein [Nitrosopumilus sp.]
MIIKKSIKNKRNKIKFINSGINIDEIYLQIQSKIDSFSISENKELVIK